MTRRDFELIAACLRNAPRPAAAHRYSDLSELVDVDRASIARAIALELQLDNPRFDCERFLTACGVMMRAEKIHAALISPSGPA